VLPPLERRGIGETPSQVRVGSARNAPWRTLDEVKAELMRRAGRLNAFEDIRREDAEQVAKGKLGR
jgi:hypothetical protein